MTLNLTPHAACSHWSSAFVGRPWALGAEGPDAFDCWGLVREVQRAVFGRELPALSINVREVPQTQWATLRDLVQRSDWRCGGDLSTAKAGDVILMRGLRGPHIGVCIGRGEVLHAPGWRDEDGDHGAACIADARGLKSAGFGRLEIWSHA